jgi:glutamyl-Q tRNA(Asp) synthetase
VTQPVFRFAPSPNGRLHLGHAYSALLNFDLARHFGGRFLLRIEDIDTLRCRPEFEIALLDDLSWLGLTWEKPVRRQSEHFEDYREAGLRLKDKGVLYPCFCSRGEIGKAVAVQESQTGGAWPRDPDGGVLYPGTCRNLDPAEAERRIAEGHPHSWRIDLSRAAALAPPPYRFPRCDLDLRDEAAEAHPERWGDAVVIRKDVPTSYHLSVVVDDAVQRVTHVVRGQDLEAATGLHVLLQRLLNLPTPRYHHHGLIRDGAGEKLSKSIGSESFAALRARGVGPREIRTRLGLPEPSG